MDKVLQTATSPNQKFSLVQSDFENGKYAIRYAVGSPRENYMCSTGDRGGNLIKTWKTLRGVTKAWLKLLKEMDAQND